MKRPAMATSHQVELGSTWKSASRGFATFRYAWKPASVDASIPGFMREEEEKCIVEYTTTKEGKNEKTVLHGHSVEPKDTECILVWDGARFKLERISNHVNSL